MFPKLLLTGLPKKATFVYNQGIKAAVREDIEKTDHVGPSDHLFCVPDLESLQFSLSCVTISLLDTLKTAGYWKEKRKEVKAPNEIMKQKNNNVDLARAPFQLCSAKYPHPKVRYNIQMELADMPVWKGFHKV